jgi:hypothetical protein
MASSYQFTPGIEDLYQAGTQASQFDRCTKLNTT